ncbi:uncharacterized protein PG998_012942 [Apiospora kogelbergensis]|uniref:uncharacterized protein n=1 Tax=Apiospora kogelbergensis TaxID=1337665 RepID=UPI00312EB920
MPSKNQATSSGTSDPYQVLQVDRDANQATIDAAYQRLKAQLDQAHKTLSDLKSKEKEVKDEHRRQAINQQTWEDYQGAAALGPFRSLGR